MDPEARWLAIERLHRFPRARCGFFPTPLEEMPRLREALGGGPRLWIKRDDYSGPGFGGNKVRKLEYVMARALADGVQALITIGGEKSNHARVTAAMCARFGLKCCLVLNPAGVSCRPASLYLDELYGAEIRRVKRREERVPAMQAWGDELRAKGVHAREVPLGASTPLGALGYVTAAEELAYHLRPANLAMDAIYVSTSSGGTQAGLESGLQLFALDSVKLVGVSPDDPAASIAGEVASIVAGIESLLELPAGSLRRELAVDDRFIGSGYGIPSEESEAALQLVARTEGIVLDPVYTAKAMAAMIEAARAVRRREDQSLLFWHTGGQVALFQA